MGGAYDEVKVVGLGIHGERALQVRLQPQLHAEPDCDLILVFFPELQELIQIGVRVELKETLLAGRIDIIGVVMLRDADVCQSESDRLLDHFLHRGVTVPGEAGVDVVVRLYCHIEPPLRYCSLPESPAAPASRRILFAVTGTGRLRELFDCIVRYNFQSTTERRKITYKNVFNSKYIGRQSVFINNL